jgi:hypothetical protein
MKRPEKTEESNGTGNFSFERHLMKNDTDEKPRTSEAAAERKFKSEREFIFD